MSVIGPDSRQVITNFGTFPYSTVTAVDAQFFSVTFMGRPVLTNDGIGTGIAISPTHVLTAGHNAWNKDAEVQQGEEEEDKKLADSLRTTISANVNGLNSRNINDPDHPNDPPANVIDVNFLANYDNTEAFKDDIALLTTSNTLLAPNNVIGIIAFVDPASAEGLTIDTAGYPTDNVSSNIPGNSGVPGYDLVRSPGATDAPGEIEDTSDRRFFYSSDVDTAPGQSGSGVWHTLDGDDKPRVLGVHSQGLLSQNSGVLITIDLYNAIIAEIKEDYGTAEDAIALPENAIIGSDFGNDDVVGSYRREPILGQGGNDKLDG